MNQTLEKKFMSAMTKLLNTYDLFFEDPKKYACDLQNAVLAPGPCEFFILCSDCPLYKCSLFTGESNVLYWEIDLINSSNKGSVVKSAKVHYRWLIKKLRSRGYVYE